MKHSWPIVFLKSVDSTNNYANTLLAENQQITERVISAFEQTNGRGQTTNKWASAQGQNLTFSLILDSGFLPAEKQFSLSQVIALAIIDLLNSIHIEAVIKWPNDILVERKKISGILIENSVMGKQLHSSVIGIGLNVNQNDFSQLEIPATSIRNVTTYNYDCKKLLNKLLDSLHQRIDILKKQYFDAIQKEYLRYLFQYNEVALYKSMEDTFEAKIIGVSGFGELILETKNEVKKYMIQEIKHVL